MNALNQKSEVILEDIVWFPQCILLKLFHLVKTVKGPQRCWIWPCEKGPSLTLRQLDLSPCSKVLKYFHKVEQLLWEKNLQKNKHFFLWNRRNSSSCNTKLLLFWHMLTFIFSFPTPCFPEMFPAQLYLLTLFKLSWQWSNVAKLFCAINAA